MIIHIKNMKDHEERNLPDAFLELDLSTIRKRANLAFVFYKSLCRLILPETKRQNTRTIAELLIASDEISARMVNPVTKPKLQLSICAESMTIHDHKADTTMCVTEFINKGLPPKITIKLGLSYQPVFLFTVDGTQYVTNTKMLVLSFFKQSERYLKSKTYDPQLHEKIVWLGHAARNQVLERELRDMSNIVVDLQTLEEMKLSATEELSC
jgi:hypothetical protein